ncbi:MAG: MFS transporter [Bacteroidetes bacterium]|nr:MAG: MFS transporter [Bacteroidota bacterium]TAG88758.1 MAG: MFS transporter [Bacteroidota bacterium]
MANISNKKPNNISNEKTTWQHLMSVPIWVAALGYFVDIYDLILFSVVRVQSLESIGITGDKLATQGLIPLNTQMLGMLVGGIIWGILGDKKGRLSVLFGSILLYSLANIANGFATDLTQYAVLRFIAGIGLAGELGAGITLVAEILPKQIRGYGTTLVGTVGMLGAVLAYLISTIFDWRTCYFIGGGLGLMLLVLRVGVFESGMFHQTKQQQVQRGNFLMLFMPQKRFLKYLYCILIGFPTWFVIGILITLSPEFSQYLGFSEKAISGKAVMFAYLGLSIGDLATGVLSQWLQSRKKVVLYCILMAILMTIVFLVAPIKTLTFFYFNCFLLGVSMGYWALFVTISAEQFGTNLRATVATTVPNVARGTLVLITILFQFAKENMGLTWAALSVGMLTMSIALIALYFMEETFTKDLNYNEE